MLRRLPMSHRHLRHLRPWLRKVNGDFSALHFGKPTILSDAHLQALQSLSAHMKLLLDAPEHLWRLIGDKMYLKSGWLFLLARVVHRALLRDEEEETNGWNAHGIDVSVRCTIAFNFHDSEHRHQEHFPLVQRQWDTVAQFRSQIIHKATLSLRECSPSPSVSPQTSALCDALNMVAVRTFALLYSHYIS